MELLCFRWPFPHSEAFISQLLGHQGRGGGVHQAVEHGDDVIHLGGLLGQVASQLSLSGNVMLLLPLAGEDLVEHTELAFLLLSLVTPLSRQGSSRIRSGRINQ